MVEHWAAEEIEKMENVIILAVFWFIGNETEVMDMYFFLSLLSFVLLQHIVWHVQIRGFFLKWVIVK